MQLLGAVLWADDHPGELNRLESDFLAASSALEQSESRAAGRRARGMAVLTATLALLLIVAALGGAIAFDQRQNARRQQLIEQAHQVSLNARALIGMAPDLAGLLSLAAYRLHPDAETLGAMLGDSAASRHQVELNVGGPVSTGLDFSPDGRLLASATGDGLVSLWDPAHRVRLASFTEHVGSGQVSARWVAFSHDGSLLASSGRENLAPGLPSRGSVIVRNVATHRVVFKEVVANLTDAVAFSPDGTKIAYGTDGAVTLWDLHGSAPSRLRFPGRPTSLSFSPDQKSLVSTTVTHQPIVWNVATHRRQATIPADGVGVAAFGSASDTVVTASDLHGVNIWKLDGGKVTHAFQLPRSDAFPWTISAPVGDVLAVADENGLITIWNYRRHEPIVRYQDRNRSEGLALALSDDGGRLASGGLGRTIVVREHAIPAFGGSADAVNDIKLSPDGGLIASAGSDDTVRLWNLQGDQVGIASGLSDQVEAVAFDPAGTHLAAVTRDRIVTVWELPGLRKITSFPYRGLGVTTDIVFAPEGRTLVAASRRLDRCAGT